MRTMQILLAAVALWCASASQSPALAQVPVSHAVSPSSGTGTRTTFSFQYSSAKGVGDIEQTWQMIGNGYANNACMIGYYTQWEMFILWDDSGIGTPNETVAYIGDTVVLENSQCRLYVGSSTRSGQGDWLTVILDVEFKPAFSGTKTVHTWAYSGTEGYAVPYAGGSWTVPSYGVSSVGITPNAGAGMKRTFNAVYESSYGAAQVGEAWLWIGTTLANSGSSCVVKYSHQTFTFSLLNDAATAWQTATAGSQAVIQNSQCAISMQGATHAGIGNQLSVIVPVTFKSAFIGDKQLFMRAISVNWLDGGVQDRGDWTVAPTVSTVTPAIAPAGATVTLTGEGFGMLPAGATVKFGSASATLLSTNWSDTSAQVLVPSAATGGPVTITRSGKTSNGVPFTVAVAPQIQSVVPTWGPAQTVVTISGADFGSQPGGLCFGESAAAPTGSVCLGTAVTVPAANWSTASITATVPAGTATGFVVVRRAGLPSNGVPFTVGTEEVQYYHTDAIGSVRSVTGHKGYVFARHDFLPFGQEWPAQPGSQERIGYADTEVDKETGNSSWEALNYIGARSLHTQTGRFTSVDPGHANGNILDPQSWNGYSYAGNNPLRFVDPSGMYVCDAMMTGAECDQFEQARLEAEKAARSSKDKDAIYAIQAYGARGVDNGVTIAMGTLRPGAAAQTEVGTNVGERTAANPFGANIIVRFDQREFAAGGAGRALTVAHEGSHVADGMGWIASGFSERYLPSMFTTELTAFQVSAATAPGLGITQIQYGNVNMWQPGWSSARVNAAIFNMLTAPAGIYGITPVTGPAFSSRMVSR